MTDIKAHWIPTLRAIADAEKGTVSVPSLRAAQALQRRGLVRYASTVMTWHATDLGREHLATLDANAATAATTTEDTTPAQVARSAAEQLRTIQHRAAAVELVATIKGKALDELARIFHVWNTTVPVAVTRQRIVDATIGTREDADAIRSADWRSPADMTPTPGNVTRALHTRLWPDPQARIVTTVLSNGDVEVTCPRFPHPRYTAEIADVVSQVLKAEHLVKLVRDYDRMGFKGTRVFLTRAAASMPAYELNRAGAAYIGRHVRFTATAHGRSKAHEGVLQRVEAVLPVGDKSFTGIWLDGTAGCIWAENDDRVQVLPADMPTESPAQRTRAHRTYQPGDRVWAHTRGAWWPAIVTSQFVTVGVLADVDGELQPLNARDNSTFWVLCGGLNHEAVAPRTTEHPDIEPAGRCKHCQALVWLTDRGWLHAAHMGPDICDHAVDGVDAVPAPATTVRAVLDGPAPAGNPDEWTTWGHWSAPGRAARWGNRVAVVAPNGAIVHHEIYPTPERARAEYANLVLHGSPMVGTPQPGDVILAGTDPSSPLLTVARTELEPPPHGSGFWFFVTPARRNGVSYSPWNLEPGAFRFLTRPVPAAAFRQNRPGGSGSANAEPPTEPSREPARPQGREAGTGAVRHGNDQNHRPQMIQYVMQERRRVADSDSSAWVTVTAGLASLEDHTGGQRTPEALRLDAALDTLSRSDQGSRRWARRISGTVLGSTVHSWVDLPPTASAARTRTTAA